MADAAGSSAWLVATDDGVRITARIAPRASRNQALLEDGRLKIRVTAAPEDGRANAAVVKLLAKQLRCAKGSVAIVHGASSRDKVIEIGGVTEGAVIDALAS